jgi:hypothetical protein
VGLDRLMGLGFFFHPSRQVSIVMNEENTMGLGVLASKSELATIDPDRGIKPS